MTKLKDPPPLDKTKQVRAKSALMGKRHDYDDQSQRSLGQIAQMIGFSSAEISELERLYVRRFKEIKS